jgi:hypothetical protein
MDWVENNYLVRRVWDDHHIIYVGRRVSTDQIQNRVDARVGDSIQLLGYEIAGSEPVEASKLRPLEDETQTLDVTVYWQADAPPKENYHVFVQLLDQEGWLVTQHDGQPVHGYLPTGDWSLDVVIPDRHSLPLPDDLPAGNYQLIAGMYVPETQERLPVHATKGQSTDDFIILTQFEIGS